MRKIPLFKMKSIDHVLILENKNEPVIYMNCYINVHASTNIGIGF